MPPTVLNSRELAELLGASYAEVMAWARRGDIPSIKGERGHIYFNVSAVIKAIRRRQGATAEAEAVSA